MKQILILLDGGFESSSGLTPEFKSFAIKFKNSFKKELAKVNAELISFSRGHFYVSGFFIKDNQTYYFSLSDVRGWKQFDGFYGGLLYRTAKDTKDFTGGSNQYVKIKENMIYEMNF